MVPVVPADRKIVVFVVKMVAVATGSAVAEASPAAAAQAVEPAEALTGWAA